MMSEESKRKNGNHLEPSISTDQTFDGHDGHPLIENRQKSQLRRLKVDYEESFDKLILAASAAQSDLVDTGMSRLSSIWSKRTARLNSFVENPTSSLTQRRVPSTITRQAHATDALDLGNDKLSSLDRMNVVFIGEDAPKPTGTERSNGIANNQLHKTNSSITNDHEQASRPGAKLETFLWNISSPPSRSTCSVLTYKHLLWMKKQRKSRTVADDDEFLYDQLFLWSDEIT